MHKALTLIVITFFCLPIEALELTQSELTALVQHCIAEKGCTYDVKEKKNLAGQAAYAISTFKNHEEKAKNLEYSGLRKYLAKHRLLLGKSPYALGIWVDEGLYYLDVVTLIPKKSILHEDDIVACAIKFKQLAAYDLERKTVIPVTSNPKASGRCPIN